MLHDDNRVQLDGPTTMAFSEDVLARFRAYGWHTDRVEDGTDVAAIEQAIGQARQDERPSIIAVRTVIGFYHGGLMPYAATFLTFSDYMRGSVRLAALSRLPVTYVWTHDSVASARQVPPNGPSSTIATRHPSSAAAAETSRPDPSR